MKREQAHQCLRGMAKLVREEGSSQEVWKLLEDPEYSNILVGFTQNGQLRYITAVARRDRTAKGVRYSSVGDLNTAKKSGDPKINVYNYQWTLPAAGGEPETMVFAIGRDPDNLSTKSLKRIGADAGAKDDD